jgi:8-oxo-dGTP diphosphatase
MIVRVVAGVMRDGHGRVLINERPPGKHMSGYWEFPGGKVARGESAEAALARELSEELGVRVERSRPLVRLRHDYADRTVELDVLIVESYQGVPQSLEGQALKWVRAQELSSEVLLPADLPIVQALVAQIDTAAA